MYPVSIGIKTFKKITSYSSVLAEKLAYSLELCYDVHYLKKLHACTIIQGLGTNTFLGSKLLNAYAFFGLLTESRSVFSGITNHSFSLWNSVFVGYFRAGEFDEVLRVYLNFRQRKIGIHGSAFTFSLKSCIQLCRPDLGKAIHVDILKFGLNTDRFVGSSLIVFYSMCKDMVDACKVFDEITERDIVAYTSLITGYTQSNDYHAGYKAFALVQHMQADNLEPNRVTLVNLLQAALQLRLLNHGESIHAYAVRRGISCFDEVFKTSLMDMYIKCGAPHKATVVFSQISTKITACWNVLINGHLKSCEPFEALSLFSLMAQEGYKFDLISLANGVLSCANLGLLRVGKSIHGYMFRTGVQLDVVTKTALIDMYSKCDSCGKAREIFNTMKDKDVISFNVMMADIRQGGSIHGFVITHGFESKTDIANQVMYLYVKCDYIDYARQVFDQINHKDLVSWTSMMMGYENLGHANEVITLFYKMMNSEKKLYPDVVTLTCLLQAFSRLGCLSQIKEIHCQCIASWNTMIAASGMHSDCFGALELINQMKKENIVLDDVTFMSALSSCSHAGLIEEGLNLFKMMKKEYGLVPGEEHYGCVVDLLGRAGQLKEAFDFLKCVPPAKSGSALGTLVAACRVHGNSEMGEALGRWLLDFDPENSSSYGLVSNLYAESERWNEAAHIRATAKHRGLKTTTGFSLIEIDR
ncbi:hypothetical protein L1987_34404 [Smallanthus sonchifolius]|uniref:Uncharacterized protein n=1 Tax=Smallanthus sonchifolius TaxID=185202 RepID=A0ACB9HTR9_9ASTR|nr:hypothetical protein L1987_34404 [Smallanthus sonchifolius]